MPTPDVAYVRLFFGRCDNLRLFRPKGRGYGFKNSIQNCSFVLRAPSSTKLNLVKSREIFRFESYQHHGYSVHVNASSLCPSSRSRKYAA